MICRDTNDQRHPAIDALHRDVITLVVTTRVDHFDDVRVGEDARSPYLIEEQAGIERPHRFIPVRWRMGNFNGDGSVVQIVCAIDRAHRAATWAPVTYRLIFSRAHRGSLNAADALNGLRH